MAWYPSRGYLLWFVYWLFGDLFAGTLVASDERVQVGLEELQDLKGVWSELAKVWEKVDELKEKPWLSVQPRKVSAMV